MDISTIFKGIKDIGLEPVLIILLLLFLFRSVMRLEKENERLLKNNEELLKMLLERR
ncbi:MAG: hypothetical protein AB1397_01855 [bacterium]